jgi:two-component sensor histidine kinase
MALIHEQLYQPGTNTEIEVKPYLMELTRSLLHSYHIHENRIRVEHEIEDIRLDVDRMIPIGIMANEILSNALKHAFGNNTEGAIRLEFSRNQDTITLRIHDNGLGVPADFKYETSRSFGMRMIHSLAKKIDAEVTYASQNGTLVTVRVPASDNPSIHS